MNIIPYEKNAKTHISKQLQQLAAIVREVGWRQPVLVNQAGVIIAGHGRWFAWKGYKEEYDLPEIWIMDDAGKVVNGGPATIPMTSEQETIYRIADNKLNESEWDMNIVIGELKLVPSMIDLSGFSVADFEGQLLKQEIEELSKEKGIDLGKYKVVTVEPPEAPRLRARVSFYFDTIEEFEMVKKYFGEKNGRLDVTKLKSIVKPS